MDPCFSARKSAKILIGYKSLRTGGFLVWRTPVSVSRDLLNWTRWSGYVCIRMCEGVSGAQEAGVDSVLIELLAGGQRREVRPLYTV